MYLCLKSLGSINSTPSFPYSDRGRDLKKHFFPSVCEAKMNKIEI